jgi:hypothetical protein
MDRRKFVSLSGAGAAGLLAGDGVQSTAAQPRSASGGLPPLKVRLGHELGHLDDKVLDYVARFGVEWIGASPTRGDFVAEMVPDEGVVDFVKVLKVYREVGYDKIPMPDHALRVPGNPGARNENFAFEFGYIHGLIQAEQHIT